MRTRWLSSMALCGALLGGMAHARGEHESALQIAEQAAITGDRVRAIGLYQDLLAQGVNSVGLQYNLGTLYLESGDVGRAMLHLRSALLSDPSHEDAQHNWEVAIAARQDRIVDASRQPPVPHQVASWLAPGRARSLLVMSIGWMSLLLGGATFLGANVLRRALRTLGLAVAIPALAGAVIVLAQLWILRGTEAVLLSGPIEARVAPSTEAEVSFTAHAGLFGVRIAEENGFVRLRLENGLDAWVPAERLGFVAPP